MLKNILCVAAGAVVGAGVTAVFGANIVTKSIEKKKELGNKYIPDDILSDMIDEIKDIDELKEYVIKLKKALMEDDEIEMEKILVELSKFEPSKQTETDDEDEDDFIIDPEIQAMLDEMDNKLSEVFNGFNQQYEDISDKINIIYNMLTGEDEESDEDEADDEKWKEIKVNPSQESSEEANPEAEREDEQKVDEDKEATHESVLNKMNDTVISPLCSKYGEDLRQPLESSVCKLVDCGDDNVVAAYLKKFTSAVRSSRGSKKQIQKFIAEIEKLPIPEPAAESSAE